jgi:restriction system protein
MIQLPLLRALLRRGGMIDIRADGKALFAELGKHFGLTPEQQRTLTRSGKEPAWVNRVRWTRQRLINNGDLDGSQRGIWRLTNQGRRRGESAEDT